MSRDCAETSAVASSCLHVMHVLVLIPRRAALTFCFPPFASSLSRLQVRSAFTSLFPDIEREFTTEYPVSFVFP
jgi:hypothetical protein